MIPLLLLPLLGGAIADRVDRRRSLLVTEGLGALASVALALNARGGEPNLALIYVLTSMIAALYALGSPAFRSATPLLVGKEMLPAAAALEGVSQNLSSVVGPTLAGVLIGWIGLAGTYLVDAISFVFILGCVFLIRPIPPRIADEGDSGSVQKGCASSKAVPFCKGRSSSTSSRWCSGCPTRCSLPSRVSSGARPSWASCMPLRLEEP